MRSSAASASPRTGEPILFFHIPKTAGTALRNLFATHLGEERVTKGLVMRLDEALIRYADAEAICGHFFVEQGHSLPVDRISMTVLRDPVDRFLSYFYFRKHDAKRGVVDQRVHALDIDAFVDQLTDADLDEVNLQTILLYPLGTSAMTMLSWPERVLAAQRAVDSFDHVGLQEELDDFVCMICARMGWASQAPLDRINATSRRHAPEHLRIDTRKKLDQLLQYDRAVYEHAVARFRQLRRASILGSAQRHVERQTGTDPVSTGVVQRTRASIAAQPREFGDRRIELLNVFATGELSGNSLALIGEQLTIHVEFVAHEGIDDLTVGFLIRDEWGLPVFGTNSHRFGETYRVAPGSYRVSFSFVNRIGAGAYVIDARLVRKGTHLQGCYHWKEAACRFDVNGWATVRFEGRVMMDATTQIAKISPEGSIDLLAVPPEQAGLSLSTGRLNPPLRDFSARLCMLRELPAIQTDMELLVDMEVENTGVETWRSSGKRPVCVSYHWHDTAGNVIEYDGLRTRLSRDVPPGERIRLVGLLRAPQKSGAARLTWTLVQEEVAWFDHANAKSQCRSDVLVT